MVEICTVNYMDHVGIAVKDIYAALQFFENIFGLPPGHVADLPQQGVRATLLEVGQTRLELLQPLSDDTTVGRFLARHGEGLHHLALNVTDLSDKLRKLEEQGIQLVDKQPREGLSGTIAFIHPRSVFGVLTELVESRASPRPA